MTGLLSSTPQLIEHATASRPDYVLEGRNGDIFGARWNHPAGESQLRRNAEHVLVYHLSGNTDVERLQQGVVTGFRSRVGTVTFMPRDSESDWRLGGNTQVIHLYLRQTLLDDFARDVLEREACPEIEDFFAVSDTWLDGFFRMLASEAPPSAASGNRLETLVLDQVQSLLVSHLVTRYARERPPGGERPISGGKASQLRQSVLKKINVLIHERLHEDISLKDLAELACISKDHFLRAFRDTVGQTPYHYLLSQRLERAKMLLREEPGVPVAEVARRCGFKNLSHFSATFRRMTGISPKGYRN
ncbi:helix-turn-helix transcriptional regulator [Zoogloea sp.]|jgi:AraC family transcriptional regulator|uniref:helix-turn-helix transcriptional regulator n=1 Tax=Zoogloea sp. TaxID=49181 RepID=UPI0037D9D2C4